MPNWKSQLLWYGGYRLGAVALHLLAIPYA